MDSEFYEGVVDAFDPLSKKHKVLYVDGNEENLNLEKESWFLLGNTSCHQVSCLISYFFFIMLFVVFLLSPPPPPKKNKTKKISLPLIY
ncbi:unnamed protein product [Coffea canephora]|uniref:Uncharacterized protein n=1 Tax=Coffea canephora TaxID=49390 RepID=A0A068VD41_COFCA|nr:unnamed protein product [Coffea canephora]